MEGRKLTLEADTTWLSGMQVAFTPYLSIQELLMLGPEGEM